MQRQPKTHRQSPDLNQTKVTPRTRPTHESGHDGQLKNPDPNRKYCLVPKDEGNPFNYDYYKSIGYDIEFCKPNGVRINLGSPPVDGKPLEWRGHVLMSCSLERAQEIFLKGATGNTGQEYYDRLMLKIKKNELEKRVSLQGATEEVEVGDLEQNSAPVFR